MAAIGGQHPTVFASGASPVLAHESGDSFARTPPPKLAEFGMNAWTPIDSPMGDKDLLYGGAELSIFSFALTHRALAPCIIPTLRDAEDSAHDDNGKFLLELFDKLIFHLDSREKMLTTFLRMSRSCCTLSRSRL